MSRKYIIFYPFKGTNAYIENMKRCWGNMYKVISPEVAAKSIFILLNTKAAVLNWIEGELNFKKKEQLIFYKLLGIKIIWVFHNRLPHNIADESSTVLAKKNMRFMANISDAIILHSQNSKVYLLEYSKRQDNIFYVPHINYTKQYRWGDDFNVGEQCKFKFVFQGHLEPYKNIDLLIKAFKELGLPHCQLCIVGRPYSEEYARNITEISRGADIQIKFGILSEHDVGEEIRKGNVMVLPYDVRSSMNSGAMITAFSNKRTVIISGNAMAKDYKDKDFLYIYHYKNRKEHYESLKATMKKAYENGISHNKIMGQKAYEYTKKHNDDAAVIQRLKKVMEYI